MKFLLGVFTGFCIVMLLCGLLNVLLVSLLPQLQFWLNLLGALYMLYLAIHTMLSKPPNGDPLKSDLNTFRAGLLMQFLNLKVILYGVTVYSVFITPVFHNPTIVSLFAPLLALVGFIATSCWALGGAIFRSFYQRYYLWLNLLLGALLIWIAVHSLFFNQ